jgi:hypothetical protein
MHVLPAFILGLATWIVIVATWPSTTTILTGPLIVSGVVLAATALPGIR